MKKLKIRGLHGHVIDEIGKRIVSGEFAAGTALPGEMQLCELLGISRTALREALRVLSSKGLVKAKQKVGTRVCSAERWNYLDADILSWQLATDDSGQLIEELYELRHLIEPMAASLAACNARAADIKVLREAYQQMLAAGDDGEKIAAPDVLFHQAIIAASGNRLFSALARVVGAALAVNFDFVREAPRGHAFLMPAHKQVLDAIENRDSSAARLAMQKLIEVSQREAQALHRPTPQRIKVASSRKSARGR